MKILLIHNRYTKKSVSGENIVFDNEKKLLKNILGDKNVFVYEVSNDKVSKLELLINLFFSFKHYKNVKNIVKHHNIDLVHVHNFYPILSPSIFKASKVAGAKVIHTLHNYRLWCIAGTLYREGFGICELCIKNKFSLQGVLNKCYRKSLIQSLIAQLSFSFYKSTNIFKNIDYFIVLTNFQKHKVKVLGIDEKKIILKPNTFNIHTNLIKNKEGYIYVGRLEESKGIYILLNVWKQLDENFVLTIVGSGDIEEKLRNEYNYKNIIFKGRCNQEKTSQYIAKSKYLIQPSIWYETFGLTIVEAMGLGIPVIGFNIGTRNDFIVNKKNGFLSTINNFKNIIEKSYNYYDYELLSNNARKNSENFKEEIVISKQIEMYKKIINEK